jgi:hypothetical protein
MAHAQTTRVHRRKPCCDNILLRRLQWVKASQLSHTDSEVRISVKRDLIHRQKSPTIISIDSSYLSSAGSTDGEKLPQPYCVVFASAAAASRRAPLLSRYLVVVDELRARELYSLPAPHTTRPMPQATAPEHFAALG